MDFFDSLPAIRLLLAIGFAAIGCWTDLTQHRIPNLLTGGTLATGLILFYLDSDLAGLLNSLAGVACAGGIYLFYYALGGFGAGDVKMIGALGGLVGFPACLKERQSRPLRGRWTLSRLLDGRQIPHVFHVRVTQPVQWHRHLRTVTLSQRHVGPVRISFL